LANVRHVKGSNDLRLLLGRPGNDPITSLRIEQLRARHEIIMAERLDLGVVARLDLVVPVSVKGVWHQV
jgi:hypothetical protein